MDELKIEFKLGIEPLKEIYFTEGRGSIFSYVGTRIWIRITVFLILLSFFTYLFSFTNLIVWIVLFVLSSLLAVVSLIILLMRANKYYKWKAGVMTFLKAQAKCDKRTIVLNDSTIEHKEGDSTTIEKWESIKHVSFQPSHILLTGETEKYVFPAKSMETGQYEELENFIRDKMKTN